MEWKSDNKNVYIGRNMPFYVKGATERIWKNPFSVKKYSRDKCLILYKKYLDEMLEKPQNLIEITKIKGKKIRLLVLSRKMSWIHIVRKINSLSD